MEVDIMSAIKKGFFRQVPVLTAMGHDVNARDVRSVDGRTALICCTLVDNEQWGVGMARTLLERGALVGLKTRLGLNALHFACMFGRTELTKLFMTALDFDLRSVDILGNTALHYAASAGHLEIIRILGNVVMRYGGRTTEMFTMRNAAGLTATAIAMKHGHNDCAREIIRAFTELGSQSAFPATQRGTVVSPGESVKHEGNGPRLSEPALLKEDSAEAVPNDLPPVIIMNPEVTVVLQDASDENLDELGILTVPAGSAVALPLAAVDEDREIIFPIKRRPESSGSDYQLEHCKTANIQETRCRRPSTAGPTLSRGDTSSRFSPRTPQLRPQFLIESELLRPSLSIGCKSNIQDSDVTSVMQRGIFTQRLVNAAMISGPNPIEKNKTKRYTRCHSAAPSYGRRSSFDPEFYASMAGPNYRSHRKRDNDNRSKPVSDAKQDAAVSSDTVVEKNSNLPLSELVPRLYNAFSHQFTPAFRLNAVPPHSARSYAPSLPSLSEEDKESLQVIPRHGSMLKHKLTSLPRASRSSVLTFKQSSK